MARKTTGSLQLINGSCSWSYAILSTHCYWAYSLHACQHTTRSRVVDNWKWNLITANRQLQCPLGHSVDSQAVNRWCVATINWSSTDEIVVDSLFLSKLSLLWMIPWSSIHWTFEILLLVFSSSPWTKGHGSTHRRVLCTRTGSPHHAKHAMPLVNNSQVRLQTSCQHARAAC